LRCAKSVGNFLKSVSGATPQPIAYIAHRHIGDEGGKLFEQSDVFAIVTQCGCEFFGTANDYAIGDPLVVIVGDVVY
jgi:hypothetical protein